MVLKNSEEIYSNKSIFEKRDILFDLLKDVEKVITYEDVRAKDYPKFVYEEKVDKKRKTYPKYLNNEIDLKNKNCIIDGSITF